MGIPETSKGEDTFNVMPNGAKKGINELALFV
jgi:hypothetical protein